MWLGVGGIEIVEYLLKWESLLKLNINTDVASVYREFRSYSDLEQGQR